MSERKIEDHTLENIIRIYERAEAQGKGRSLNELARYIPELVREIERLKEKHDRKQNLLKEIFIMSARMQFHPGVKLLSHSNWAINDNERE